MVFVSTLESRFDPATRIPSFQPKETVEANTITPPAKATLMNPLFGDTGR